MASRFLRRRSMRLLMGQSGSSGDLQNVMEDTRALRERSRELLRAESEASESQLRWAFSDAQRTNGSKALQEVLASMHELHSLLPPISEEYLESLHALAKTYKELLEQDRQVERLRRNAQVCELKARKLHSEVERRRVKLSAGSQSPATPDNEAHCTQVRAQQAKEAAAAAQRALAQAARDCAFAKLVRVRQALTRVCDARLATFAKQQLLCEAQKALLSLLPDGETFADATVQSDCADAPADPVRKTLPSATKSVAREIVSRTHAAVLPQNASNAQNPSVDTLRQLLQQASVNSCNSCQWTECRNTPCASFAIDSPAIASRTTNRSLPPRANALNLEADTDDARSNFTATRKERSVLNLNVNDSCCHQVVRSAGRPLRQSSVALPSAPFASASASPVQWPAVEEDRVSRVAVPQSTLDLRSQTATQWRPTFLDSLSFNQARVTAAHDAYQVQTAEERYLNDATYSVNSDYPPANVHGTPC